jgi:hypothetical protein
VLSTVPTNPPGFNVDAKKSTIPRYVNLVKRGFELLAKKAEPFLDGTPLKIPVSVLNVCFDLVNVRSLIVSLYPAADHPAWLRP